MKTLRDKTPLVIAGLFVLFIALVVDFAISPDQAPVRQAPGALAPAPKVATVRMSAAQLVASGGDTSILDCYSCHDEKEPPEVKVSDSGQIILPPEHSDLIFSMLNCTTCHTAGDVEIEWGDDGTVKMPAAHQNLLVMAHGQNNRNDNCYNCHNRDKLDQLVTRDGTKLTFDQATLLCASCHGPIYRDWEEGVHGRINGYWDTKLGDATRQQCTSCHDPHAPAIPKIIPLPGPKKVYAHGDAPEVASQDTEVTEP